MSSTKKSKSTPPMSEEDVEVKGIAAANLLALEKLENGTATSQIILHFLELGTLREKIRLEKMQQEARLLEAKIKSEESSLNSKELAEKAIEALKTYTVQPYD